jgi:hypothetical protein
MKNICVKYIINVSVTLNKSAITVASRLPRADRKI